MQPAKMQQLIESLKQVKRTFDDDGLVCWLDYGALLGAVREGAILPWDHDVDLGIWIKDEQKLFTCLERLQRRLRFRTSCHYLHSGKIELFLDCKAKEPLIEIALWNKDSPWCYNFVDDFSKHRRVFSPFLVYQHYLTLNVDLSINRFKGQLGLFKEAVHKLPHKIKLLNLKALSRMNLGYGNIVFFTPMKHLDSFDELDFYGESFKVPHNPEDYLVYVYGSDWRTPKSSWATFEDQTGFFTRTPERGSFLYTKV